MRNGIRFDSTDRELIEVAKEAVARLLGLNSQVYLERRAPPWKSRLRLWVYSRNLVSWLKEHQLKFGTKRWNVPKLPKNMFCSYLAGIFDAEGQVMLARSGMLYQLVIHSANGPALQAIAQRMSESGVESFLRK